MQWTSMIAIWFLFWVMGCYIALRFGMRTDRETGNELVPGQSESAPAEFRPGQVVMRGTIIATALFGLHYANWTQGWITLEDLNIFGFDPPPLEKR